MIPAGPLDRYVTIEQKTKTRDAYGAEIETWTTFAQVWASKRDIRGREYFAAQQVNAETDTVWRIRWIAGVKAEMRINWNGTLYDIQDIAEIGRREGLEIMARVRVQ